MLTTSQIVERVKMQASDWSTVGDQGIIPIINEVDQFMNDADIDHMIYVDPANDGLPPYLRTVADTHQYSIPTNLVTSGHPTARKLASIFIEKDDLTNDMYRTTKFYRVTSFRGDEYYEVLVTPRRQTVSSAGVVTEPTITFPFDPGTTADQYYVKYWRKAHDVVSVNIQPNTVPEFHHLLVDGVLARIQPIQYGSTNPWLEWINRMKIEYWGEMNYNPPRAIQTMTRPC